MIEMRWQDEVLQMRLSIGCDASGAFCPGSPGDWADVPRIDTRTDPTFAAELAKHSAPVCLPAVELDRLREFRRDAIELLRRAYDSGHRHGWEPGESTSEVMNALHAFLENETDG